MAAIINVHIAVKLAGLMPIVPGIAPMFAEAIQAKVPAHAASEIVSRTICVRVKTRSISLATGNLRLGYQAAQLKRFANPERPSPDQSIPKMELLT